MSQKNNIQNIWDLTMLYSSPNDPQIEKDVATIGRLCTAFAKKYEDKDNYLKSESALLTALKDYEDLYEKISSPKPLMYFMYVRALDGDNKKAEREISRLSDILTKHLNTVAFFTLSLGKITESNKKKFLRSKKLQHFHYFLEDLFKKSDHFLTLHEEKILNLKSMPSYELWVNGMEKLTTKQVVRHNGVDLPIAEAQNTVATLKTNARHQLQDKVMDTLYGISDFAESEINAIYTDKKIEDELRGFKTPYDATVLGYENDPTAVRNLVDTVTRNFKISKRFYKVKAKLLKMDKLAYADRAVGIKSVQKKVPFEKGLQTLRDIFADIDPWYRDLLDSFLLNGQVDIFPRKHKSGGAFCSSSIGHPTFVLLNHVSDFNSVMTFAHEMGHAIHSELSKEQSPIYQGYSISTAEVASTLFENIVFDQVFETLSDAEKVYALHDKIQDDIQTIFRQIACFNFELELHQKIREEGFVSKEHIAELMNKHMQAYLGPVFDLSERDGYFFVQWSHIRRFFYVYTYAFGQLISTALFEKYKEDKTYFEKIERFLRAGGSKTPEEIFKDIGIDVTKPEFFETGLKSIEKDIRKLEKLAR